VLEVFRLGSGVTVERVETLPPIAGTTSLRPGRPVTLEEAARLVEFEVVIPKALGPPDAVYFSSVVVGGEVNLVYRPRPGVPGAAETGVGVLVNEFASERFGGDLVNKLVDEAGTVERLRVGADALWVTGPHNSIFGDPSDLRSGRAVRLAANVLVVERDDAYVRIESRLSRDESVRIAESLAAR
jgi:hypothetical protein